MIGYTVAATEALITSIAITMQSEGQIAVREAEDNQNTFNAASIKVNLEVVKRVGDRIDSAELARFLTWASAYVESYGRVNVGAKWTSFPLRGAFYKLRRKATRAPLLESLSTEIADRLVIDGKARRLELRSGPLPSNETNSRHNFHLAKDQESAYVILKTKEFIAEAMSRLEMRGRRFYWAAGCAGVTATVVLATGIYVGYGHLNSLANLYPSYLRPNQLSEDNFVMLANREIPYQFLLKIVSVLGYTGLVLITVKMLFAFCKACMHEGAKQFERRHAMRFGWLYMELTGKQWSFEDLKEAFQWNREATSAFRDIDLKQISETSMNALLAKANEVGTAAGTKAAETLLSKSNK